MTMPARVKAHLALLVIHTHPEARHDRFNHVLAEVKRAGIARLRFAGSEVMAE